VTEPEPAAASTGTGAVAGRSLARQYAIIAAVTLGVLALDQISKTWALERLRADTIDVFWTLRLRLTFNSGAAFSLGDGIGGSVIGLLVIGVVAFLIWSGRTVSSTLGAVALGMVLGGALGNLADRAFRAGDGFLGGRVVDFIDFQWWPVFNVADMGVVIGAILLVFAAWREGDAESA
jgi:signal peptidase II